MCGVCVVRTSTEQPLFKDGNVQFGHLIAGSSIPRLLSVLVSALLKECWVMVVSTTRWLCWARLTLFCCSNLEIDRFDLVYDPCILGTDLAVDTG